MEGMQTWKQLVGGGIANDVDEVHSGTVIDISRWVYIARLIYTALLLSGTDPYGDGAVDP